MPSPAVTIRAARAAPRLAGAGASATLRMAAYALIVLGIIRLAGSVSQAAWRNDFAHYYLSGQLWLAGENPYVTPLEPLCRQAGLEYDPRISRGGNPPLLTAVLAAVAWMPASAAYMAWASLQWAALGGLLAALRRLLDLGWRDARWLILVGAVLNANCLQRQFYYSQVQVVVAVCLAWALIFHTQQRHSLSCALATFAAAFKIYPAALLPWFVFAAVHGRRDLLGRVAAVAGMSVAVLALTGIDAWRSFAVDGLPVINQSVGGSLTNYSLPAAVNTIAGRFWGWPLPSDVALFARLVGKALATLAVGAAYLVVWRRRLHPAPALGLLTAAMLAASLVCWSHYFVLTIVPIAWLWRSALKLGAPRPSWPLLLAGTLCLWPELDWMLPVDGGTPRLLLHYYPLVALGIAATLLAAPCDDGQDVAGGSGAAA